MVAPLPTPSKRLANIDERCNSSEWVASKGDYWNGLAV